MCVASGEARALFVLLSQNIAQVLTLSIIFQSSVKAIRDVWDLPCFHFIDPKIEQKAFNKIAVALDQSPKFRCAVLILCQQDQPNA